MSGDCLAALLVPVTVRLVQEFLADRGSIAWRLLLMAVPPAFLGFVVVALSTSSGWFRGVAFIGLAPLAVVLLGNGDGSSGATGAVSPSG